MALPDINELYAYAGIDYADNLVEKNATRALKAGLLIIEDAIGEGATKLLEDDHRLHELLLVYAEDLYSKRGILNSDNPKVSGATRRLVNDLETQLRLTYKKKKQEVESDGTV